MRRVSKMHTECTQVSTQTLCGCYFLVLCKCVSFFRTTTLSSESSECRRQAVNSMKALLWAVAPKGSNLLSYTPPPPHSHPSPPTVMNLLHQQGLSALQIQARRLAAWEQISLLTCSSSSILTQDFIALSRGRITPDKSAYGHERMCTCEQEPVKSDGINARAQNVCWFFYCQFK